VCVCVCVCVCMCVHEICVCMKYVHICVCVCVCTCVLLNQRNQNTWCEVTHIESVVFEREIEFARISTFCHLSDWKKTFDLDV